MSMTTNEGGGAESRTHQIAAQFNMMASEYDLLGFPKVTALRLVELLAPQPGERVIDAGAGTGWAALAIAHRVGSAGHVTGIDVSEAALEQARRKASAEGLFNITFRQGDVMQLDAPDASLDAVASASVLAFLPDHAAALREWRRVLRPGGRVLFSSFGPEVGQPMLMMMGKHLERYDGQPPTLITWPDPEQCRVLLQQVGFTSVEIQSEQLDYFLPTADAWWREVMAGILRPRILRLPPEQQEQVRVAYLKDVQALMGAQGLRVPVPVTFASGVRG
jgi:ubiquinone/menaquinone biosynthesis C-methylase UbiE